MNRFTVKMVLAASLILMVAATSQAAVIKGTVKSLAAEARLLSLIIGQEEVLSISWDDRTSWKGLTGPSDIKRDELLSVDFSMSGETPIASSVSREKTPVPEGVKTVPLDSLIEYLGNKDQSRLVVDTRPLPLFETGHIPGAVSIPLSRLEKRQTGLLPENKDTQIVFYDEGQGGESAGKAAAISMASGYRKVAVFQGGTAEWLQAGRTLASSPTFIRKVKPVVIDLRTQQQVVQGHIAGAANFPAPMQKKYYGYLPMDRLVPIVLYGATDKEATDAAEMLRSWGYRRVTIYPGGADSWAASAEALETGPAGEEITAAAANRSGKLRANDFEMALISPGAVEIVDARSAAEQKRGGFPQAKKIPLAELAKRHGELDRSSIQVVFATDSLRAEMAYDLLKAKGYRVTYFNGSIEFNNDSKYKLKED